MAKFEIGDQVTDIDDVGYVVTVKEIGVCEDVPDCELGGEVFRFTYPGAGAEDWEHSSQFKKV